ncbi:type II secretion system GspH family protein [Campylobacter sp. JMF_02 ED1]|uniref:type II secretion system protein n=1 Tax=unclassified Campylobacter TaxID=2593542 RepID=UPI0022E9F7ED|nr:MULTISPECIES: prepilin-type N-terminal cleavage/methylation domain-containing protein [unclassified Campylobacter]MDA3049859.1 type II secretion system GspH family protein [Campylobacter sp. JMF_15 NE4]MDA3050817.1 type II secretion system GspH family protein [Campylobacter sp. JMF_02 ED1]
MKQAFTMIELIFVIVILGILAAVAIPRLAATRDDAEMVKTMNNITTSLSDLMAYYTSQARYSSSIATMTNVTNPIKIRNDVCATYEIVDEKQIILTKGYDGLCKKVWAMSGLSSLEDVYSSDALIIVQ